MRAAVCIEMGWTGDEFDRQPWSFIDSILHVFKERERAADRAAHRASLNRP